MRHWLAWSLAATLTVGCGGNVVVDKNTTSTTTIDTGGAGGEGGYGGAGGDGGTGGTGAKLCGGKQGYQCDFGEWCDYDPPGSCGGFDNYGTCQPMPQGCPADCPGVCGCDGQFYCNACEAHGAGVDTSDIPECGITPPPADEYNAYVLPTNAPRYAITKASWSQDRCLAIVVVGFGSSSFPNVDVTMGWAVESISITPNAADCVNQGSWPPSPGAVSASDAKGGIKQDDVSFPCFVDVDVAVAFPPGSPAWVPPQDSAQAFGLKVQGTSCTLP